MTMEEGAGNTLQQRIRDLETELSTTKYNKRTQNAVGLLKAKIATLREKFEQKSKKGGPLYGFAVRKTGDATVCFLGYPSVGKSTLLNKLTNANSPVASYAFTTVTVIPGLMEYKKAKIQLLDIPGIIEGASIGSGRGREVLAIVRSSDLMVMIVDAMHPEQINILKKEIYNTGIRINQNEPDVKITRTPQGGVVIGNTVKLTHLNAETIRDILKEFRIMNASVLIRQDLTADQLIDVLRGNCRYCPCIIVANKSDLMSHEEAVRLRKSCDLMISAINDTNLDLLRELIFQRLGFIRVFCKEVGKKPDLDAPVILQRSSTVEGLCLKLHKDFVSRFKIARVWGKSAKFPGQQLGLGHALLDQDVVEIHLH
jgi:small GTP-binding protein